jgi:hypothetical protein
MANLTQSMVAAGTRRYNPAATGDIQISYLATKQSQVSRAALEARSQNYRGRLPNTKACSVHLRVMILNHCHASPWELVVVRGGKPDT